MSIITKEALASAPISWDETGENNGKPIRTFKGYGHSARVVFGFDRMWGAVVDNSGKLFSEEQEQEAISYAEKRIREKLIIRFEDAARFRDDITPLLESN